MARFNPTFPVGLIHLGEKPSDLGGGWRVPGKEQSHGIVCRWPSCFPLLRVQSEPWCSPEYSSAVSLGESQILLPQLDLISCGGPWAPWLWLGGTMKPLMEERKDTNGIYYSKVAAG